MGTTSRHRAIRRLRAALLAALVVLVAGVAGYWLSRPSRDGVAGESAPEIPARETPGQFYGEGFEFEFTQEDASVLQVAGNEVESDAHDRIVLRGARVTTVREDGTRYEVVADKATHDPGTSDTRLEGSVVMTGSNGLTIWSPEVNLRRGQVASSPARARFRFGGFEGAADSLSVNLRRNLYQLRGSVEIDSVPGAPVASSLRSDRLVLERDRGLAMALGKVTLSRGELIVNGRRIAVHLSDDESGIEFVRARWGVDGSTRAWGEDGAERQLAFSGVAASVAIDPVSGDPTQLEIEGRPRRRARLHALDGSGAGQRMTSDYLIGHLTAGRLEELDVVGPLEIEEFLAVQGEYVVRRACALAATATFAGSELRTLELDRSVEVWQAGLHASGHWARVESGSERLELLGDPARVLNRRGYLEAPRIERSADGGNVAATGGVRAIMEGAMPGSSVASSDLVEIEAAELTWTEAPELLTFRRDVRAWQGRNLLLADELEEAIDEERLTARGGVKTVLEQAGGRRTPRRPGRSVPRWRPRAARRDRPTTGRRASRSRPTS